MASKTVDDLLTRAKDASLSLARRGLLRTDGGFGVPR
jgi:hypothetical protein